MASLRKVLLVFALAVFTVLTVNCNNEANSDDGEPIENQNDDVGEKEADCGCSATSRNSAKETTDEDATVTVADDNSPDEEPQAKAETVRKEKQFATDETMERTNQMVEIPGGTFLMGLTKALIPGDGETPQRKATVETFWMDVYEVSNNEFSRFVDATEYVTEVCLNFEQILLKLRVFFFKTVLEPAFNW